MVVPIDELITRNYKTKNYWRLWWILLRWLKNKKLVMLDIDDVYNKNDVFTDIG